MIDVTGLHKSFENNAVLRGIDLHIPKGESLAIIGGSGSGKSVLLKCILGLETPDAGSIAINGAPLGPAFMDQFGMLFQGAALFDSLPIWQNVAFRLLRTLPKADARARAIDKLAIVGLGPETADLYPAELSGGMQKRAGLARAIAADPAVIFCDEPTTGLDPIRAAQINALIRQVVTDLGVTAVTITHDMTSVTTIADTVAMLAEGRIHWHGPKSDFVTTDDPRVREFTHP